MNNYYNIDTNAHYLVPMRPRSYIPGFISFVSSSDPEYFIECEVQPYDIEGIDYKCYLLLVLKAVGKSLPKNTARIAGQNGTRGKMND